GGFRDLGALAEVLAVGHRQLEQLDVRPVLQPLVDLQPGGAVLAVDENFGLVAAGHGLLSRKIRALGRANWRRRMVMEAAASSPAASRSGALSGARVLTPLGRAAASRREGGERLHRGGIFHPAGRMSRPVEDQRRSKVIGCDVAN